VVWKPCTGLSLVSPQLGGVTLDVTRAELTTVYPLCVQCSAAACLRLCRTTQLRLPQSRAFLPLARPKDSA
jgi:hypothetical protein